MKFGFRPLALLLMSAVALTCGCSGSESRKNSYEKRGDKYLADQNYDKARIEYSNALQIDPKDDKARYFLGLIAERLHKPQEALANYQAVLDSDPNYVPARAGLGRVYLMAGLSDKALETVEVGLQKQPADTQLRIVRGAVRAQRGELAGALDDADVAVKSTPQDESAIALLASLFHKSGRDEEAIAALATGLEKLPRSIDLQLCRIPSRLQFFNVCDLMGRYGNGRF